MEDLATNKRCLIDHFFTHEMIKMLYYHASRVDIEDNNEKAELIRDLIGPNFTELGTGTNRIVFLHNSLVVKIAMDFRGMVDNFTEYKRATELPNYLAMVHECNMVILICEYVNVMDKQEFQSNESSIKLILEQLSEDYLFDDIGFSLKNSFNWGYRDSNAAYGAGSIVILDYGYLYPKEGQESAFICPKCKSLLHYNQNYTGFICTNRGCSTKYRVMDIRRRMNLDLEDFENKTISNINNLEMMDFEDISY